MLKYAIARLQQLEQDFNRREAMVRTVINADKQAKTNERIRFLLECKRASVYPKFIIVRNEDLRALTHAFADGIVFLFRAKMFILKTAQVEIYQCIFVY